MRNMNNRRLFKFHIFMICLFLTGSVLKSECLPEDIKRVILVETMPVPVVLKPSNAFLKQMAELGYTDGKNFKLIRVEAMGDRDRAERLIRETLVEGKPDLVVTLATVASMAAAKVFKGTRIPIIFFLVDEPVGAGLVERIGVPSGTNITGKVNTISRESKINIVLEMVGQTTKKRPIRFGYIHSTYPSEVGDIQKLMAISNRRSDIVFIPYKIPYRNVPSGIPAMVEDTIKGVKALRSEVDFWWLPTGALSQVKEATQALLDHSSILIAHGVNQDNLARGALMFITPDLEAIGREAAFMADKILKGKNPGEIPVIRASTFTLAINVKTALKLNIVISPDLLELAGDNLYR